MLFTNVKVKIEEKALLKQNYTVTESKSQLTIKTFLE